MYPQLMAGEVLIQDAASLAAPGERLTYWQLQARVHSVRQTLLGAPPHTLLWSLCFLGGSQLCVGAAGARGAMACSSVDSFSGIWTL